jgi:hypothetical protein
MSQSAGPGNGPHTQGFMTMAMQIDVALAGCTANRYVLGGRRSA